MPTTPSASAPTEPRPSQSSPDKTPSEAPRFGHDELIENARAWLKASPHAVAGALASQSAKTLTVEKAASVVDKFLKRPDSTVREGVEVEEAGDES